MRAVVIRVSRASITINGVPGGKMEKGFVVLVGVKPGAVSYTHLTLPTKA